MLIDGQKAATFKLKREEIDRVLEIPARLHKCIRSCKQTNEWTRDIEVEGWRGQGTSRPLQGGSRNCIVRTVAGAEVYIDDNYVGAPRKRCNGVSLLTGQHRIKAKKNEYQPGGELNR